MLARFARWLGCSHLVYPIDSPFALRTEVCRHGKQGSFVCRYFFLCIRSIIPWWPDQRGRHRRPSMNGFRRLVALSGPRGSHVHTDGREKPRGNPTDHRYPVHTTSSLQLGVARLRKDASNGILEPSFAVLPADVSACALDTRRCTTILLGRSLARQRNFPGQQGTFARLGVAVGPLRRRHRTPPLPVLMHKSTTIPGHGLCRGQGLLIVSSCPLTGGLGRQFGSGE